MNKSTYYEKALQQIEAKAIAKWDLQRLQLALKASEARVSNRLFKATQDEFQEKMGRK